MGLQLPIETTISMMGLEDDIQYLKNTNISHHNVVHTDSDGTTRSIHIQIIKDKRKPGLRVKANYFLNAGQNYTYQDTICDIAFDDFLEIESATILGETTPNIDKRQIYKMVKDLKERVGVQKKWTNFIKVIKRANIDDSVIRGFNWPGLAENGEIKAIQAHKIESESEPVFPALFLPGIVGCGPEAYAGENEKTYTFHTTDSETGDDILIKYHFKRGKTPLHFTMSCHAVSVGDDSWKEYPLYELKTTADKDNPDHGKIKSFKMHHANAIDGKMDKVDIRNQKALSVALKSVRMLNRTIRGGEKAFREEQEKKVENRRLYMPSDIWAFTGLNDIMIPQTPAPKRGRFSFTPMGGQGTRIGFSDDDLHLGGNAYRVDYYPPQSIEKKSVTIDCGIQFGDPEKDGLHAKMMAIFKDIANSELHFPAHGHQDHIGGDSYMVKYNYKMPVTILTPDSYDAYKDDMTKLKVSKKKMQAALDQCIVINVFEKPDKNKVIPVGATKENPHTIRIRGKKVDLYWEYIQDDNMQTHRYPAGKCGDIEFSMCLTNHSLPGFAIEIRSPAGSVLHLGDCRVDDTAQFDPTPMTPWLKTRTAKHATLDVTRIGTDKTARTPKQDQVIESQTKLFAENADKAWIATGLGSSVQSMTSYIASVGKSGRQYLLIEGLALNKTAGRFNNMADLKKWAKEKHGVEVVTAGMKKTMARVFDEEPHDNYAVYVTGSQIEDTSVLKRLILEWFDKNGLAITSNHALFFFNGLIPVGDNARERRDAKYVIENFHGGVAYLPEDLEKNRPDITISASGHASYADAVDMLSLIPNLRSVMPIHGNKEQLDNGVALIEGMGLKPILTDNNDNILLKPNGDGDLFRVENRDMVGIQSHYPDPLKFYLAGQFSTYHAPTAWKYLSPAGQLVYQFEKAVRKNMNVVNDGLSERRRNYHLRRDFNASVQSGFLAKRLKFGAERYDGSVYDEKNIFAFAVGDTETYGKDEKKNPITEYSAVSYDIDWKKISATKLRQAVPDYFIPNPEALLVTMTEPGKDDGEKFHPVLFADQIIQSIEDIKKQAKKIAKEKAPEIFEKNSSARAKVPFFFHNLPFDDKQLRALFKDTLSNEIRPHASNDMIGVDTLHLARAIHAIYPDRLKVRKYPDSDFLNFTLQALCEENGISYDLSKAHNDSEYDATRLKYLVQKMQNIADDIVQFGIFNADKSSGQLLNDMRGHYTGEKGPLPVFSYLSKRRDRTDMRMGCFICTIDNESKAVVANLAYNPQDFLLLSQNEIAKKLADRNDDTFEVIDLGQNPMVYPAKYFYETHSSKVFSRQRFDHYSNMINTAKLNSDPKGDRYNFEKTVQNAWANNKYDILIKYDIIAQREPDLTKPVIKMMKDAENEITVRRNGAASVKNKADFNPISRGAEAAKKEYRKVLIDYLEALSENKKSRMMGDLNRAYKKLMKFDDRDGWLTLTASNIHYDIAPNAMTEKARQQVVNRRAFLTQITLDDAVKAINKLETDQDHFDKIIGRSFKKRRIFKILKGMVGDLDSKKPYDANAAKNAVTTWKLSA